MIEGGYENLVVAANKMEVRDSKVLINGRFLLDFPLYCFQVFTIADLMTNTSYLLVLSSTIGMTCTGWDLLKKELAPRMSL